MFRRFQQLISKLRLPREGIVTEFRPNCICLEDRELYSAGPFEVPDSSVNLPTNLDVDSFLGIEPITEPYLFFKHSAHSTAFQRSIVDLPDLPELRDLLITDHRVDHIDQLIEDIERLRNSTDIASEYSESSDEMLNDDLEPKQPLDAAPKFELIIVDTSVAGYYDLMKDIIAAAGSDRTFEIAYLDTDQNGVVQITQLLSDYQNLDAVHLISHGSDGELALGSERLNRSNLDFYSAQISQWSSSFAEHGDFLVYGCNLAESQSGIEFVESLAALTRTDVAASRDFTGSATLGGDWILEYSTGQVESNLIFTDSIHTTWSGLLATIVVDTTSDYDIADSRYGDTSSIGALLSNKGSDNQISLREAIDAANRTINGAFIDEIHFNIPDDDARHFYYRDNGVAGSLSLVVATTLNDAAITDFDPDYPYAAHSWFRINVDSSLPQLSITDAVIINGYTQPGATQNTLADGQNARLRIELTSTDGDNLYGLHFDTGGDGSELRGLAINGFEWSGVMIDYGVANVTLQGNFIGTDITGTLDRGNGDTGIQIRGDNAQIGGPNAADRNIISGSNNRGIALFSGGTLTGTVIENNFIGVDATGLNDLGNNTAGIQVYNSDQGIIRNNVISGNAGHGIWFRNSDLNINNTVQGNYIGLGADGSTVIANDTNGITIEEGSNNTIGGSGVGDGNVISGNTVNGILLDSSSATNNIIIGNLIGTNAAGTANRGNGSTGILLKNNASGNVIGGTAPGEGNKIAFNGGSGVGLTQNGTDRNAIRGNRIYSNAGLGIDLNEDGVSANDLGDGDSNENQMQNFPVLTSATISGSDLTVTGSLNSTPTTSFNFDFFASTTADGSGHGQAERYLGSATGLSTDGLGNLTLNLILSGVSVSAGEFITATATDPNGNTSEFALNVVAVVTNSSPIITSNGGGSTANINIAEGTTAVTTVTASDADLPANTLTYNISGGADAALFNINPSSGVLTFISARDFETRTDANLDGIYQVQVTVNDGNLGTDVQTINVTVTDANDSPVLNNSGDLQLSTIAKDDVGNNGNTIAEIIASNGGDRITDQDGDPEGVAVIGFDDSNGSWEFSINGGSSWSSFASVLPGVDGNNAVVLANTDRIRFVPVASFIGPAGTITFRAWDGTDGSSSGDSGVNAAISGGASAFSVAVETASIEVAQSLIANDDSYTTNENTPLTINGPGVLGNEDVFLHDITPGSSLNFQAHNNATTAIWQDTNGASGFQFNMTGVAIDTNPDDNTPGVVSSYVFGGGSGSGIANLSFEDAFFSDATDNAATFEIWFRPTDDSGKEVIFETGGGTAADHGLSLRLRHNRLEFLGYNNNFYVELNADISSLLTPSGGEPIPFIQVSMTVDFVDSDLDTFVDDLALKLYVNGVLRDTGFLRNTLQWSEAVGETFGLGNVDGTAYFRDGGTTAFEGEIGIFRFYQSELSEAEIQRNYNAVASAQLQVTAHDAVTANGVAITVNPDGSFTYNAGTMYDYLGAGQTTNDTFNYTVQDSLGNTDTAQVTITITGLNDAPIITSNGGGATANVNVDENSTTVTTVTATDPDDASLIYSISGGNDAGLFIINATTGELSFIAAPDFEMPADFDGDNIYDVEVLVEDAFGLADSQLIAVSVGPRNDNAPAFTNSSAANVAEGTTAVVTVNATDADQPGDTVSYSIVGGSDASRFTINGLTGQLSFVAAPDFETPIDANGDNVYEVIIRANDGVSLTSDLFLLVTVIPVNEFDPVFTTPSTFVRPENTVPSFVVGASDSDSPSNVTYSLSANPATDNALFTIDSSTGVVSGLFVANYEAPLDSDADSFYVIEVIADDGFGRTSSQLVMLEIVDVAEYPVVGNDSFAVNEGMTYVSATGELLINDNETNGLALSTSLVSGPAHGSLWLGADGTFTYVHDGSETTSDSFVYRSTSASGLSTIGLVTITIIPMQDPTIVANDVVVTSVDTAIIIDPSTLLANDFDVDSSVFNVIPLFGSEINGTLAVDGSGNLVFIPSPAFIGTASFQYMVVADGVTSGPATVAVEVISPAGIPPKGVTGSTDDDKEDNEELETTSNDVRAPTTQTENTGLASTARKTANDFTGEATDSKAGADDIVSPSMEESELSYQADKKSFFFTSNSKLLRNVNFRSMSDIDSNIEKIAGWIWQDLNELKETLLSTDDSTKFWSVMTPTFTTGLSVGYVMWLIKGGQLMAGLMAQVPAWKLIAIDPLPILKSLEEDDEQESDSLASLVDKGDQSDSQQEPSEIVTHENLQV